MLPADTPLLQCIRHCLLLLDFTEGAAMLSIAIWRGCLLNRLLRAVWLTFVRRPL
jgi:hypothetical protein